MSSSLPSSVKPLSQRPGVALHRQIFIVLRDRILAGAFPPASALPKEEDLCDQFGVSRITVRRALADLAAANLIERRHGRGSFVMANVKPLRSVPDLAVIDQLRKVAARTDVKVLELAELTPPNEVAGRLKLPAGEAALFLRRLRGAEAAPLMLTEAWLATRCKGFLSAEQLTQKPLHTVLTEAGIKFGKVIQEISATAADPAQAQWLHAELSAPLIKLSRLLHDEAGQPLQYLTAYLLPERSRILMEIDSHTIDALESGKILHDDR